MTILDRFFSRKSAATVPVAARYDIGAGVNSSYARSERGKRITVRRDPLFSDSAKIFALGSCFAREIRVALRVLGYDVYPRYFDIEIDPERQHPNMLPKLDNINHYDTFVIRQEIERALAGLPYSAGDFWRLEKERDVEWSPVYCDPYRRKIFARDMDALVDISEKLTRCIGEGLAAADVVIITLGLTECWRNNANGLFVCDAPPKRNAERRALVTFHRSTFQENYDNVAATLEAIRRAYPDKRIIITVSPVALSGTQTDEDVVVANMTSKSTLRAVASEICRAFPEVVYWPSYEYAMASDVFEKDGRHVRPEAVQTIISTFLGAHGEEREPAR